MKSALLLTVPIAASASRLRTGGAEGGFYGKLHCPCVGLDGIEGESEVWVNNHTEQAVYPANNGARCSAWDDDRMANCKEGGDPGKGNSWCGEQWCYVDPCNCVGVESHRSVRMQGVHLHGTSLYYSYETCGGQDHWSADHNTGACNLAKTEGMCFGKKDCIWHKGECTSWDTAGLCDLPMPDDSEWGHHSCPCVLPSGQNGTYKFLLGEELTTVKAGFGSTCQTWDTEADPACKASEPPPHCEAKWCYVDSQHCPADFGPVKSGYFPMGHFSGHPIAFSYQTCGNEAPEIVTTSSKSEETTSTSFIVTVAEHPDGKTKGEPVYNYSGFKKNWTHEYGGYVHGKSSM